MATLDYSRYSPFNQRQGDWLASMPLSSDLSVGQSTMSRRNVSNTGVTAVSGALRLTYWTGIRDELMANTRTITGGTAAVTVTLHRIGLYTVAANGDLTLVASTPNDTTLWIAASTRYTKALSAAYTVLKGVRYATGILSVATTTPTFTGANSLNQSEGLEEPKLSATVTGLSDLPSSIANASLAATSSMIYAVLAP